MSVRSPRRTSSQSRPDRRSPVTVERVEARVLMAIDVAVGVGAARSVTFTDADGTVAVVRAAGGTATVTLDGANLTQTTTRGAVTVGGAAVMTGMVLAGPNPGVTVTTSGGEGLVTLGGLSAAGPVGGFSGRGVVLGGATTLANGIGKMDLAGAQGATITITRGGQARLQDASLNLGDVADVSINSQQPFRLLRVNSWADSGQADQITTLRVNSLQSAGAFDADLSLSGNGQAVGAAVLGNARVGGPLGGEWFVAGRTGRVSAASASNDWDATFGDVAALSITGDLGSRVTASSINTITAGSLTGARIRLTRPQAPRAVALNRLNVRGAITATEVRSNADIGTVSAASMASSNILAGITGGLPHPLPLLEAAFFAPATIRSVTLRDSFSGSNVAASTLGRVNLGVVNVANAGTPMGLAALTLNSLGVVRSDTNAAVRGARLTEPSQSLDLGDFEVRIF